MSKIRFFLLLRSLLNCVQILSVQYNLSLSNVLSVAEMPLWDGDHAPGVYRLLWVASCTLNTYGPLLCLPSSLLPLTFLLFFLLRGLAAHAGKQTIADQCLSVQSVRTARNYSTTLHLVIEGHRGSCKWACHLWDRGKESWEI